MKAGLPAGICCQQCLILNLYLFKKVIPLVIDDNEGWPASRKSETKYPNYLNLFKKVIPFVIDYYEGWPASRKSETKYPNYLNLFKKVIPFVIDYYEGWEINHLDFADSFHP